MKVKVDGDGNGAPPSTAAAMVNVAVAVKSAEGKGSQRAVRWAVEKLLPKAHRFFLIHVMPTITAITTPSGESIPVNVLDDNVVEMYIEDMMAKCKEIFIPFKNLCKRKSVETVVLEGDNPATLLLQYVTQAGINALVLGSSSPSYFSRRQKDSGVPSVILKHAPESCDVYVVSSNGLVKNSFSPLLPTETEVHTINQQESNVSYAAMEFNRRASSLPDFTHLNSPAFAHGNSNIHFRSQQRYKQNVEEFTAGPEVVKGGHSSTCSEQSDIQAEMERMRLELQNTIAMYNQTCEHLIHAQNKVQLLSSECLEEARRVNAAQKREESLRKTAAEAKKKHVETEKEVRIARKLLAKEACERQIAELKALQQSLEKQKVVNALMSCDGRYRRLTREEIEVATDFFSESKMIGEGGYGKVYKGNLDHTPVAIKILHPDASQKKEEFLREVEVLSQLHHPNIVLLLGASPENGCLVYEYMENGSLEDYIFQGKNRPLPWFVRFRILFEVAYGLAFLHNSKPEPIVHRDLKPGNILLDKNYVSKIGDVGLAKIMSDIVPESITEYRDSIIAGTLAYMDPEYQRTGTLRPKSDLYAFGIIALQLLAACHPNGLIMKIEKAIDSNSLVNVLDKSVVDWPLIEAEELAKMALQCCKLRCRDRPDLETEVLPLLKKLFEFAEMHVKVEKNLIQAPSQYFCPILQEVMQNPHIAADGFTYEHRAIKAWIDRHNVSPVTKQRLQHKMLTPNHTLRLAIQDWRSHS
ncbi:U-box domain-containing protein 34-like isoform X1 [Nicotiana tomentosiformis]|uniref:U-box domain-containing protein 34-like isoform X1 n=2 Tax=Nicotiana tomentosiformis TaxID=4098 RepID=UPI00051BA627|nr:U-box domain-containing protein 34-like isoform X1 [Nicotiana tomentosiformis]